MKTFKPKLKTIGPRLKTIDTRSVKPPAKKADPFYLSPEWRALMNHLYRMRGRICEECSATNCRIFGDHIVELKDGGAPLAPENIKLLCGSCHTRKTAQARAKRMAERF